LILILHLQNALSIDLLTFAFISWSENRPARGCEATHHGNGENPLLGSGENCGMFSPPGAPLFLRPSSSFIARTFSPLFVGNGTRSKF
jgi:hypothetical protein